ncbi:hypothetical protein GCM10018980_51630 [Streptomyces capoamus]|uniref:Uncharacterized protein n=1 Tax=Streptomyces capoamus TaxID=68183 RepID=A0A919EZ28_9ACTN|nr:hypothetical protein [Streptomyces capoamus]GGW15773.1 hypothetical protein GCM10010501_29180 [Streptomyces libani subsp. rufus]GHG62031.1 hypothetical protein GCM10018980_51630 [Streptomyces capoamus]
MSRLARGTVRLATGSAALARRLGARLTAWVARGRRHDLTGWRAALGCWLRIALLVFGLYMLWRVVRAVPALMWLLSGVWTAAAWRAGRPAEEEPAEATADGPSETAPALDREAVRTLLLILMGDGSGVHLRTVLAHLQQHPPTAALTAGWKVPDLRARLVALEVPVDRGVKVAGVPTWGVRRRDLEAPSPVAAEEPSTEASTAA